MNVLQLMKLLLATFCVIVFQLHPFIPLVPPVKRRLSFDARQYKGPVSPMSHSDIIVMSL